jgi:hypothetical protein
MHPKLAASILFLAFVWVASLEAQAAKLPALAEITAANGTTFIFDPAKVSAVYVNHIPLITRRKGRRTHDIRPGPLAPHIWGITTSPLAIKDTPEHFLQTLHIDSKFIPLTSRAGILYLKATTVITIVALPPRYDSDARVKSYIFPGPTTNNPWVVFETPEQVRKLIDEKRQQESLE